MTPDFKAHPDGESSSLQAKTNKTHHSAADSFSPLAAKDLIRRLRECLALNFGGDGRRGAIVWERDDDT